VVTISGLTNYSSIDAFRNKFAPNNIVMLTQRKNNNMVSPIFLSLFLLVRSLILFLFFS